MAIITDSVPLLGLVVISWIFSKALHNLFNHPLRGIPGPRLWIAFPLIRHWVALRGELEGRLIEHHRRYGDIVRFSADELSCTSLGSMKDIYASHPHRPALPKAFPTAKNIVQADSKDHPRYRRILSQAFSDKSLRAQEPLIRPYVDLLVSKLGDAAALSGPQDMVKWYNLTTFDIFGELTFRESFHGLRDNTLHEWISGTLQGLKLVPLIRLTMDHPIIARLLQFSVVRKLVAQAQGRNLALRQSVHQHMKEPSLQSSRGDFLEALLKNCGKEGGLTDEEIFGTINNLLLAASETSATALSGMTYYLLMNPPIYSRVTAEVRGAFQSPQQITFQSTSTKLPYLQACIDEAMRLYPPVPMGIERRTPPDRLTRIGPHDIPGGTKVVFNQAAAYTSPDFFHQSENYVPERWLTGESQRTSDQQGFIYNGHESDHREIVQPFSIGPRSCIGRSLAYSEMRLISALILYHFDLELCEQSRSWRRQKVFLIWQKPALWCNLKFRDV